MNTKCNEEESWKELNCDGGDLEKLLAEQTHQVPVSGAQQLDGSGFDVNCGDSWIYPSNLLCRAYQYSIAQAALYKNTLVVLPTGLGKTFIAAVVMYNFYRWYPQGKLLFLAPTRPLVAQQIEACQRVMQFATQDTVELTGRLPKKRRIELWREKRVFFATPQVVQSDIMSAINVDQQTEFPFKAIRLLVIDEAHRAKGRYAYTDVVETIWQRNRHFRLLALSATPGRSVDDVVEVVRNLLINHLEIRWENSIDVVPYVHKRTMKTIVVPLSAEIKAVRDELVQIIDPYLRQLIDAEVLSGSVRNMSRNFLLFEQKSFRERSISQRHPQQAAVNSNFSTCISLYHALELLERHGLRAFLNNFDEDEDGRTKYTISMDGRLRALIERLRSQLGPNPFDVSTHAMTNGQMPVIPKDLDFGHPKFEEARKCLLEHFEERADSRAIVFCEYRESVMLIYRLLLQHVPVLRPRCFVGQGGTNGSIRALTQKQQLQIMKDFRSGKSNILVATSIGEEGIDVGEVDLIVCFDISTSNPQRFVQRIGRTGRQRQGKVIMLVTEGRERALLKDVLANRDQTNRRLLNSSVLKSAFYTESPRMVPPQCSPKCIKTFVTTSHGGEGQQQQQEAQEEQSADGKATKKSTGTGKGRPSRTRKSAEMVLAQQQSQDLRKFFKKATPEATSQRQGSPVPDSALHSVDVDVSDIAPASNTQLLAGSQKDPKRMRKLNKFFKSMVPLVPQSMSGLSLQQQLRCDSLSNNLKLHLLKSRPSLVRDIVEQMTILAALDAEPDLMSSAEGELRETYRMIEQLFGGKDNVLIFLEESDCRTFKRQLLELQGEPEPEFSTLPGHFEQQLSRIFVGLDPQGYRWDNFDYIQQELKKTKRYERFMALRATSQQTDDSLRLPPNYRTVLAEDLSVASTTAASASASATMNDSSSFCMTDSKYCSQWGDELGGGGTKLCVDSTKVGERETEKDNQEATMRHEEEKQEEEGERALFVPDTEALDNLDEDDDLLLMAEIPESVFSQMPLESSSAGSSKSSKSPASPKSPQAVTSPSEALARVSTPLDKFHALLAKSSTPQNRHSWLPSNCSTPQSATNPGARASTSKPHHKPSTDLLLDTLDVDMDAFLEPFPEETELVERHEVESKENIDRNVRTQTLASRLARKQTPPRCATAQLAVTPKKHLAVPAPASKIDKSPNIFDLYLKTMGVKLGQSPLAKAQKSASPTSSRIGDRTADSPMVRARPKCSKRKIFESDSGSDGDVVRSGELQPLSTISDSDDEQVAPSQELQESCAMQRKKRMRHCSFIEQEAEAEATNSQLSADELEDSQQDAYQLDSMVVLSADEPDDDAPSATQMHAVYLRSVKSPQQRSGAFKMPAFRTYNDQAHIYSQQPEAGIEASQYVHDSFVVAEAEHTSEADASMCPLERAEQILKQRRRARRQQKRALPIAANVGGEPKRRIICISDSSDDEIA